MTKVLCGFGETRFDTRAPMAQDICPYDIIRGLSRTARFGGRGTAFYSVAQHSILVSMLIRIEAGISKLKDFKKGHLDIPKDGWARRLMQLAAIHDGSEAWIADLADPFKRTLPDYLQAEGAIMLSVFSRFGIVPTQDELSLLHLADKKASFLERDVLFPHNPRDWPNEELMHPGIPLTKFFDSLWLPPYAEQMYGNFLLALFPEVFGQNVH